MTTENLKINEVIKDTDYPEKASEGGFGAEIVKNQNNTNLIQNLQRIESALSHDTPLTTDQILGVEKNLDSMKVLVEGEEMTVEELRYNMPMWSEIEDGRFEQSWKLTQLTPHYAELLSKYEDGIVLESMTRLSYRVAEQLAKHKRWVLSLELLKSASDDVVKVLAKHQGPLHLGLTSISDVAAEYLSQHEFDGLGLHQLTSLSDEVAQTLAKHKGSIFGTGRILEKVEHYGGNVHMY